MASQTPNSQTPDSQTPEDKPSNADVFLGSVFSRTKRYDGWNDSHSWQQPGLPKTWMNLTSAIVGFFGLVVVPLALVAVVLGHLGLRAVKRGEASMRPLGVGGLVVGYVSLGIWLSLLLLVMADAAGWVRLF